MLECWLAWSPAGSRSCCDVWNALVLSWQEDMDLLQFPLTPSSTIPPPLLPQWPLSFWKGQHRCPICAWVSHWRMLSLYCTCCWDLESVPSSHTWTRTCNFSFRESMPSSGLHRPCRHMMHRTAFRQKPYRHKIKLNNTQRKDIHLEGSLILFPFIR